MIAGKSVAGLIGLGAVVHGFNKGFGQSGVKSSFYEFISGVPDLDQQVLGASVNPLDLVIPISPFNIARGEVPGFRSGLPRLLATLPTGLVNRKNIGAAFANADKQFAQQAYTNNQPPQADGSLIFGMYNARNG